MRKLTYDEVLFIIDQEDQCGVNNLLQEIFSTNEKIGEGINVMCDVKIVNNRQEFGSYKIVKIKKGKK